MISVFGDESHSTANATYGLLAATDDQLPALDRIVAAAKSMLKAASTDEPLHCRVLFHGNHRQKSAFRDTNVAEVESACGFVIREAAALNVVFHCGRVERAKAPSVLHVALPNEDNANDVMVGRLKLELPHLQWLAYGAAATRACHTLPAPATRLIVDQNKSVVRWFNENRQAGRLQELFMMDATLPAWPTATPADDTDNPGLQVANILTYYATKQFSDRRFSEAFDCIRHKSQFMVYEFAEQVCRPYVPPEGVIVRPFAKKNDKPIHRTGGMIG